MWLVFFFAAYIALFCLYQLLTRKHQGWKRIFIVIISISGILGGIIAYDGRGFSGDDLGEILFGVLAGLLSSLAIIEGSSVIFAWVKKGFEKQS